MTSPISLNPGFNTQHAALKSKLPVKAPRFSAEPTAPQQPAQPLWKTALSYCPQSVRTWLADLLDTVQSWVNTLKQTILGPVAPGERRSLYKTKFLELCETVNKVSGHPWMMATRPGIKQGGVVIIPVTRKNEVVLIQQHRPPVAGVNGDKTQDCIEFPAGLIGDSKQYENENAIDTAPRELMEEAGYQADKLTYLGKGAPSPGMTDEMVHYVKAENLTKVTDQLGVDGEQIQKVHVIPLNQIDQWLVDKQKEGFVINCAVFSGLGLIRGKKTTPS